MLKQKEVKCANKPGKLLAWQIKKRREKKFITKIRDKGKIISDQKGIKKVFRDFYVKLVEHSGNSREKIELYLQKLELEKVPEQIKGKIIIIFLSIFIEFFLNTN